MGNLCSFAHESPNSHSLGGPCGLRLADSTRAYFVCVAAETTAQQAMAECLKVTTWLELREQSLPIHAQFLP